MAYGYYPNYQTGPVTNPNPANNQGIIWVQGEAGAKSYLVAPNCTVQLWDSEAQVIYLKSADASGMPTMKIIDYTIRGNENIKTNIEYVTSEQLEEIKKELKELKTKLKGVKKNDK